MSEHAQNGEPSSTAIGTAVILDFDYLGVIYQVRNFSHAEAWLHGTKKPPNGDFGILLHLDNRFVECRALLIQDTDSDFPNWIIKFARPQVPSFLQQPERDFGETTLYTSDPNRARLAPPLAPYVTQQGRTAIQPAPEEARYKLRRRRQTS
jgi:hypothetical protein